MFITIPAGDGDWIRTINQVVYYCLLPLWLSGFELYSTNCCGVMIDEMLKKFSFRSFSLLARVVIRSSMD